MLILLTTLAVAGPTEVAEQERLLEDMRKTASATRWNGVERAYRQVLAIEEPVPDEAHLLAAQAARSRGEMLLAVQRLRRVHDAEDMKSFAGKDLSLFSRNFGMVSIFAPDGVETSLEIDIAPFPPDAQKAIKHAQLMFEERGSFHGLLPIGTYKLGGRPLEVLPGFSFKHIVL